MHIISTRPHTDTNTDTPTPAHTHPPIHPHAQVWICRQCRRCWGKRRTRRMHGILECRVRVAACRPSRAAASSVPTVRMVCRLMATAPCLSPRATPCPALPTRLPTLSDVCAHLRTGFHLCGSCHANQRAKHLSTHLFLRLPRHLPPFHERERTSEPEEQPCMPLLFPQLSVDVFVPC